MKKIGIITFHNSYNCGSMLESYAIFKYISKKIKNVEIIDFSSEGQKELYSIFKKNNSIKNIIRNLILLPHKNRLTRNNLEYEKFKKNNFKLSTRYDDSKKISDENYDVIVAGSDQIWNITIKDYDEAYFLNWVNSSKKVAYAPSFGAKNIKKYKKNQAQYERIKQLLNSFDAISIRENNGRKWIKEMIGRDVPVLIDPTLLLDKKEYDKIVEKNYKIPYKKYIFFYCPQFNKDICKFVKLLSKKYKLPVITWSSKSFYLKIIGRFGFKLPDFESPSVYLKLIKNAELIITTSFHGTIFSTIYNKNFYTIKNGEMYGDDDRVITLLDSLNLKNRLIDYKFINNFNYLDNIDYHEYNLILNKLREKADLYIEKNIIGE